MTGLHHTPCVNSALALLQGLLEGTLDTRLMVSDNDLRIASTHLDSGEHSGQACPSQGVTA